jgi:hypothetical protein
LAALETLVADISSDLPFYWKDWSKIQSQTSKAPPALRSLLAQTCVLLREDVSPLTPAEEDIARYAFSKQDAECLGW